MARKPTFTPDQDAEIEGMYLAGQTMAEIAEHFGASAPPVRTALERRGVTLRSRGPRLGVTKKDPLAPELEAQIQADHAAGVPVRVLARKYHVRTDAVSAAIRAGDGALRPGGSGPKGWAFSEAEAEALRVLYDSGVGLVALAALYDTNTKTLTHTIERVGGQVRSMGRPQRAEGYINSYGYRMVYVQEEEVRFIPAAYRRKRYMPEHRLVMSRHFDRMLDTVEQVHHINGDRTDNRLENLQLRHGAHGSGSVWRCTDCGSYDLTAEPIADPPE